MTKNIQIIPEILSDENFEISKKKEINKKCIIILLILILYVFFIFSYILNINNQIKTIYIDIENKQIENNFLISEIEKIRRENKQIEEKIYIQSLDLDTDDSLTKFVNSKVSFNNKAYIPQNLVGFNGTFIIDAKGNGSLREEAMKSLIELNKAFYYEFNKNITVVSSYRSYSYQVGIKSRGCPDNLCAKAGYSEHQSGLAIDLWETTTKAQFMSNSKLATYFYWLNDNAYKYGFSNTYQKGLKIDGYEIEPWHWRYMGEELATYLKENNITTAEFYNKK